MITVTLDTDKFLLTIEDSNMAGYIRILPLKNLTLIMGVNGDELTLLNSKGDFLYTLDNNTVLAGASSLGEIMGYHVALGNKSNITQSIEQSSLTFIDYSYVYYKSGTPFIYYKGTFNALPTILPAPAPGGTAYQIMYTAPGVILPSATNTYFPVNHTSYIGVNPEYACTVVREDYTISNLYGYIADTSNSLDGSLFIDLFFNTDLVTPVVSIEIESTKDGLITGVTQGNPIPMDSVLLYSLRADNSVTGSVYLSSLTLVLTPQ